MGKVTEVSAAADALSEVWACGAGVRKLARAPTARLLSRVHEGALGPIMGMCLCALEHLEAVDAKVVCRELGLTDV